MTALDVKQIHSLCDDYIEAVTIHYGGDHADTDTIAGELREQAGNPGAHEVILDRKPTSWEAEIIYDYLMKG